MNSFKLYLANNDSEIKGVVFPFRYAELLDERLDEAYVDFYNRIEFYEPLTEAKIEIYQDNKLADTLYFIIGNDNSAEYPAGSGIYKHSVYLIERTKLLDGIVCSSLTFTNTSGISYSSETTVCPIDVFEIDSVSWVERRFENPNLTKLYIKNIYAKNCTLPSISDVVGDGKINITDSWNNDMQLSSNSETMSYIKLFVAEDNKQVEISWEFNPNNFSENPSISSLKSGIYYLIYEIAFLDKVGFVKYLKIKYPIAVVENEHPLKKWTITDCVNRVLECAKPLFGGEEPEYKLNDTQAAEYDKILAPEFSMTQCTLREQLKVIGSFIHAEPWLDENNKIHFKPLGTTGQCSLQGEPYVYSGAKTDINQYCTEVRSYVQNVISDLDGGTNIKEPLRSLRTETQYARITEENGIVSTTHPIYSIKYVTCGIVNADMSGYFISPVDITPYIFESTQYNANLSSYAGVYPYSKEYALYYTIGEKDIKGLFFRAPHGINTAKYSEFAISNILAAVSNKTKEEIEGFLLDESNEPEINNVGNLVFTVEYDSMFSSIVSHEKNHYESEKREYTQIYNQAENIVESEYFGENLKGIAARLGNPEKERTYVLKNFSDIPEVGQMLDGYAISAVTAEIMPNHIKCTVGLSKDFNRISEYVGISSIKRMYEVSERQVYNRDILIKDTIVIGTRPEKYESPKTPFIQSTKAFEDIFTKEENIPKIIHAYATTKSKNKLNIETDVVLPISTSVFGNVATFTFSYKDNYSAGNKTEYKSEEEGISGRWQTDVRYTDFHGRAYFLDFKLGRYLFLRKNEKDRWMIDYSFPFNNPKYTPSSDNPDNHHLVVVDNYRIRKDSRERISVTYELEAQSNDPNIIIGSEFMRLCRLVNDETPPKIQLQVFTAENNITKFDHDYPLGVSSSGIPIEKSMITTTAWGFTLDTERKNGGYGWAIITESYNPKEQVQDEDGNIIEQTISKGYKILILCTAKNEASIILDFFLTRK